MGPDSGALNLKRHSAVKIGYDWDLKPVLWNIESLYDHTLQFAIPGEEARRDGAALWASTPGPRIKLWLLGEAEQERYYIIIYYTIV